MVLSDPTADAWLAAMRERRRLGIAMAAIIRIIATTISNSISEKPRESFLIFLSPLQYFICETSQMIQTKTAHSTSKALLHPLNGIIVTSTQRANSSFEDPSQLATDRRV